MDKITWAKVEEVFGRMEGELLKSYLEANGVEVQMIMSATDQLYAPSFGSVSILVHSDKLAEARALMRKYNESESE